MARATAWIALCCALVACDEQVASGQLDVPSTPVTAVVYRFVTDWDGVEWVDGKRSWTTALGYEVELEKWTVLTNSAEVIPCEFPDPSQWLVAHSTYTHDPSVAEAYHEDELSEASASQLGVGPVIEQSYCHAFTVHGYGVGDDVATLVGRYRREGAAAWTDFEANNPVGLTAVMQLTEPVWDASLPAGAATLTMVRYPARALDTVDFETVSTLDLAFAATQALVRDATVQLAVPGSSQ